MDHIGKIWSMLKNRDPTLENRDPTLKKHRVTLENGTKSVWGMDLLQKRDCHVWCVCLYHVWGTDLVPQQDRSRSLFV